jgi:adenylate kinase
MMDSLRRGEFAAVEASGLTMGDVRLTIENSRVAVIMLGPPGAGKGTQARKICESLKYPHISTGDMLREALKDETELGRKAKEFMDSGNLVPDDLVDAIVAERLGREDCRQGFILDGYPRTISQAEFLQSLFAKDGTLVLTLGIEVEDSESIERLSSRWTCLVCGKMFNARLDFSKVGGQCDECGGVLVQRNDDAADVIAERFLVYHKTTKPLIQYYQEQGTYISINGKRSAKEVFSDIAGILKSRMLYKLTGQKAVNQRQT